MFASIGRFLANTFGMTAGGSNVEIRVGPHGLTKEVAQRIAAEQKLSRDGFYDVPSNWMDGANVGRMRKGCGLE